MSTFIRVLLGGVFLVSYPVAISHTLAAAGESESDADEESSFVLGPYPLGDIFAMEEGHQYLQKELGVENVPSKDDMIAALNNCHLYLRDTGLRRANGSRIFKRTDKPHQSVVLLVSGRLNHVLRDRRARAFIVQVASVEPKCMHTELLRIVDHWREVHIRMNLVVSSEDSEVASHMLWNSAFDCFTIRYDASGRLIEKEQVKPP